jgi:NTE family protein
MRVLDVTMDQTRALRVRALIADYKVPNFAGAYWGIDSRIASYDVPDSLACDPEKTAGLARMRTRLDPFDDSEQGQLINWGYAVADAAIRRWAPQLVVHAKPPTWPEQAYALG